MQQAFLLLGFIGILITLRLCLVIRSRRRTMLLSVRRREAKRTELLIKISFSRKQLKSFNSAADQLCKSKFDFPTVYAESVFSPWDFLKAEAYKVYKESASAPPLPCFDNQQPRILDFTSHFLESNDYLLTEADFLDAVQAYQKESAFTNTELLALHFVLRYALIQKAAELLSGLRPNRQQSTATESETEMLARILHSLNMLNSISSSRLIEETSIIHKFFEQDDTYRKMDAQSRSMYRAQAARIARHTHRTERVICETIVLLAQKAQTSSVSSHIGYYLVDDGYQLLLQKLNAYGFAQKFKTTLHKQSDIIFRFLSWICFVILSAVGFFLNYPLWILIPFSLFLLSVVQLLFRRWLNNSSSIKFLPKIAVNHLSNENQTLVVCHALLHSMDNAIQAVKHLSVMHEANADENIHFLLLGEFTPGLTAVHFTDEEIIDACYNAVNSLCKETGHPFFYLQRGRVVYPGGKTFHSQEGRHGGMDAVMKIISGEAPEEDFLFSTFEYKDFLHQYRYVISLDTTITSPPSSIKKLIGTLLHPLNQLSNYGDKMRGYAVIRPSLIAKPERASFFSHIFLRFHQANEIAIIDIQAYRDTFHSAFPFGKVLQHHVTASYLKHTVTDAEVFFYYHPIQNLQSFAQYIYESARNAIQQMILLLPTSTSTTREALGRNGRSRLMQHSLYSVNAVFQLLLICFAALTNHPLLMLIVFLLPDITRLYLKRTKWSTFFMQLSLLPVTAFQQSYGALTAVYRLFFARQHLQDLSVSDLSPQQSMLDFGLNMGFAAFSAVCAFISRNPIYLLPALTWAAFPFLSPYLEQIPNDKISLNDQEQNQLMNLCDKTYAYFETALEESASEFPPEYIRISPQIELAKHTTPETIGMYLCSVLAAKKLRLITASSALNLIADCIAPLESMPTWNGLFYHFYMLDTLQPPTDANIQTYSNGYLAVCLLTCAQGLREMLPELGDIVFQQSATLDGLCRRMRFSKLYDHKSNHFFSFFSPQSGTCSETHELTLEGGNPLAEFVSLITREIPFEQSRANNTFAFTFSTPSEAMLPLIYINPIKHSMLANACKHIYKKQKKHSFAGIWGQSECFTDFLSDKPHNTLLPIPTTEYIFTPYASLLCMSIGKRAVFQNLRKFQLFGLDSTLGLYDSIAFLSKKEYEVTRIYSSFHQGIILCSVCNALCDDYFRHLFESLPQVQAYRSILDDLFHKR